MAFIDIVRSRRSVRTFDGKPLAENELNELLSFCRSIERRTQRRCCLAPSFTGKDCNLSFLHSYTS